MSLCADPVVAADGSGIVPFPTLMSFMPTPLPSFCVRRQDEGDFMALISCPACTKQVSEQAPTCPNCGHPKPGATSLEPHDQKAPDKGNAQAIIEVIIGTMLFLTSLFLVVAHLQGVPYCRPQSFLWFGVGGTVGGIWMIRSAIVQMNKRSAEK